MMDGSQLVGYARTIHDIATTQTGRLLVAALVLAVIYGDYDWTASGLVLRI
jgi:hypothetical protein